MARRQAASPLKVRGLHSVRGPVPEPSAQPVAEVPQEQPLAQAVPSEPRPVAAEEGQPSVQLAAVAERDALRVATAEQDAQQAVAEEPGALRAEAVAQDVPPVAGAALDVLRVAEAVQRARQVAAVRDAQPEAQVRPSEARAVLLSAEPLARSDRPVPAPRLARRRMTTLQHAQATARVEPRRLQTSTAE
jgi:hypothetical protein